MNITQISPTQLKVEWPRYPRATHQEIIRRLKLISGAEFNSEGKCWYVPTLQGDKLMDNFPKASYDVAALWACTDAPSRRVACFYDSLRHLGVGFEIVESGAIVGVGDSISPLVQTLIDERAEALRPLVLAQEAKTPVTVVEVAPLQGPKSTEDLQWESWMRGVQNAAVKAERDAEWAARRGAKRWKGKGDDVEVQGGLGL